MDGWIPLVVVVLLFVLVVLPVIAQVFLTRVDAGTIRLVSFLGQGVSASDNQHDDSQQGDQHRYRHQ
jgi:hypothetical protein